MHAGDLEQVQEIDREAFPSQWPMPNYHRELSNKLAYYIVLCDDERTLTTSPHNPEIQHPSLLSRLLPWHKSQSIISRREQDPTGQFLAGFSGLWLLVDEAHITNLAVRQAYRGRGLGEYLLLSTIDLALELQATVLTLEVRVSNTIAQRLYAKYGFTTRGIRKGYYLDNREDALIMTTDAITTPDYLEKIKKRRRALHARLPGQF
jgi:ribosomal-protein-alanine N-acetyltransferase